VKSVMNIVFFGSSQFAVPSLKALFASGHKICSVVTQPDREKGRGLHLSSTPIKTLAKSAGLNLYQPISINTRESIDFLKGPSPDLFVVIAYGQILSQEVIDIPKIFCINAHASLLPKYRGAAPINWAIINGDKSTGVTIIKITREMDAGEILSKEELAILGSDTVITLEDRLSELAAELTIDSIKCIENRNYNLIPQGTKGISFAHKLKKQDGLIDWNKTAEEIHNLIRGCLTWPGAFTYYKGKLLKIYRVDLASNEEGVSFKVGEITEVSDDGITLSCGKGNLIIKELQIEGKRRMSVREFIAGHKISVGEMLGDKK